MSTASHDYRRPQIRPVWCAGCGNYGVLRGVERALGSLEVEPERTVVVSGIGCSGRLSHYLNAYALHGTHGRIDLGKPVRHQTLGAIAYYLDQTPLVKKGIRAGLHRDADWVLSDTFRRELGSLLKLRNPAAHWEITRGDTVGEHRDALLGIGCEGFLVRLIGAKVRAEGLRRR